jgi:hypothetical protein
MPSVIRKIVLELQTSAANLRNRLHFERLHENDIVRHRPSGTFTKVFRYENQVYENESVCSMFIYL